MGRHCRSDGRQLADPAAQARAGRARGVFVMIADLWHFVGGYFYDVFVTRLDWWAYVGIIAQALFTGRFLVQWIASEKAGRSVIPFSFWILSISGGLLLLVYALYRRDPVFIMGQSLGVVIYLRNLVFVLRERREEREKASASA
jgi:lipid-A-disaccharide synthase-like uncharacterized protein